MTTNRRRVIQKGEIINIRFRNILIFFIEKRSRRNNSTWFILNKNHGEYLSNNFIKIESSFSFDIQIVDSLNYLIVPIFEF